MSENNVKVDRRVKYTKMVLKQSLLELLKQRSINNITVKDISEQADINRGTFYKYYSSPHDLLQSIENELFEDMKRALAKYTPQEFSGENVNNVVLDVLKCIYNNVDICKILLGEFGDTEFFRKLVFVAYQQCVDEWKKRLCGESETFPDYFYTYIANGSVGMIQLWIQNGMKESYESIAMLISKISYMGVYAFFEKNTVDEDTGG